MEQAVGRVLAKPLLADRDSPAINVSAMDGYAFRLADISLDFSRDKPISISAVARAGQSPAHLQPGQAVQIFTGAAVPLGADCVVRREDTLESPGQIQIQIPKESLLTGSNIRYRGENIQAATQVLGSGTEIDSAGIVAVATFGSQSICVHRRVRIGLRTTGDELVAPGEPAEPWQIRDSNSLTLHSWLSRLPWINLQSCQRVEDSLEATRQALESDSETQDAIIITGGVSMGDTDYVLPAIESLGGHVLFHRLPLRPGKPVLVAMLGKTLVIALPGNPVSVAVTSRVVAQPLLEKLAGKNLPGNSPTNGQLKLRLTNPDEKRLNLYWYRLVRLRESSAELIAYQGSGDLVSLSQSQGFIEVPPGGSGAGPWRTWLW